MEYGPIAQGLITKYVSGTISQAAPATVTKMVGTEFIEENVLPGTVLGGTLNEITNQILPAATIGGTTAAQGFTATEPRK